MALCYTLLLLGFNLLHPLHVSYTHIDIDRGKKEASFVFKFFTDDFSLLFYHLYEKNIQPKEGVDFTPAEIELINSYLSYRFILRTKDSARFNLEYTGKQQVDNTIFLYYKAKLPEKRFKSLNLDNELLLDLYEDQTNLVILNYAKIEKGYKFNYTERHFDMDLVN